MEHLKRQKKQENISEQYQEPIVSFQLLGPDSAVYLQDNNPNLRDKKTSSTSVNNFIKKTYAILQQKRFQNIVSWSQTTDPITQKIGLKNVLKSQQENIEKKLIAPSSFKIHNLRAFQQIVLPQYFKHSNMSSFVRQLNMYNFHKVRGDKNQIQFQHQKFKKSRPQLLAQIRRKQVQSTVSISSIGLIPYQPQLETQKEQKEQDGDIQKGTVQVLPQQSQSLDKKESSSGKGRADQQQSNKLKQLLQFNKSLKKQKQIKSNQLKLLISQTKVNMSHKFNKSLFALITSKIRQDIESLKVALGPQNSFDNIHSMIGHIMDTTQPLAFHKLVNQTNKLFSTEATNFTKEE